MFGEANQATGRSRTASGRGSGRPSNDGQSPKPAGSGTASTSSTPDVPEFPAPDADLDRGDAYAVGGALSLVVSVLTFAGSFLFAFSILIGVVMLPVSGLLAIVGTGLGGYAYAAHRSWFGAGVALVGGVELVLGAGFVVLLVLAIFGVIAYSIPFKWIYRLLRLVGLAFFPVA